MEDDAIKKKKPDRNLRPRRHQQREINSAEEPESGEGDDDLDENVDIKQVSHYAIFIFSITFMILSFFYKF
jgi:hypothetical protein